MIKNKVTTTCTIFIVENKVRLSGKQHMMLGSWKQAGFGQQITLKLVAWALQSALKKYLFVVPIVRNLLIPLHISKDHKKSPPVRHLPL